MKKAFEKETVKPVSQSVFWILAILYSPSKVRQIAPVRRWQILAWRWCLDLLGTFLLLVNGPQTLHVQINDAISQCTFLVNFPPEGKNVRSTYIIYTGIRCMNHSILFGFEDKHNN